MNKNIKKANSILPAILVLFLLSPLVTTHLSAEDFNVQIPVVLKNLHPDFTHLRILIKITNTMDPTHYIASSLLTFKIENGGFDKTVVGKLTAFSGMSPSQANKWEVSIFLIRKNMMSHPDSPSNWEKSNPAYKIDKSGGFREYDTGRL